MKTLVLLFCLIAFTTIEASRTISDGFSVELIHRDSPKSPFFNPTQTPTQRLANAFNRSRTRVHRFNRGVSTSIHEVQSEIVSASGEYLIKIKLGTPAVDIIGIADTGSDLIWTQCKPCDECFEQQMPLFNPRSSRTYRDVLCSSATCSAIESTRCSSRRCQYSYSYGDHSFTSGNLAVDTITMPSSTSKRHRSRDFKLNRAVIGCGHNNGGTFDDKTSGIVGLGRGKISLISQIGNSISGKFSYCLIPYFTESDNTSTLHFGSKAIVSGRGRVTTPMVTSSTYSTFYLLTLEAMSVGNVKLNFPGSAFGTDNGNIIIDSGTTLTLLPSEFYQVLEHLVARSVGGRRVSDPSGFLNLCYGANKISDLRVPTITAHFAGADVRMNPSNTFIAVAEGVACLAFAPTDYGAVYGNIAQMGYLVAYDIVKRTVSFKPTDCTKV